MAFYAQHFRAMALFFVLQAVEPAGLSVESPTLPSL
jgi:hypothetical protein